jgi:hypothetical protein
LATALLHSAPLVNWASAAALALHVMSRARLRELVVLFAIGSALTLAVFFVGVPQFANRLMREHESFLWVVGMDIVP